MKKVIAIIMVHMGALLCAQHILSAGVTIGSSDHLRDYKKDSYYDYRNREVGLFVEQNFAWKNNLNEKYNKFWVFQLNGSMGEYSALIENTPQKTFSTQMNAGIRIEKNIYNGYCLFSNAFLGFGYHSEMTQRLPNGVYFREAIVLGVANQIGELGIGLQHASNANLYSLNRGYELYYLKFGIFLK